MRGLLLAVLVWSAAAHAVSAPVQRYLNAGRTLYENLEYEKALEQLKRARQKSTGPEDDAAIALYEGIVLADMGREEQALTAFKTALSMDVDAKLPLEVSPKVEAVFEKARANVKKMIGPEIEQQKKAEAEKKAATPPPADPPPAVVKSGPAPSAKSYAWVPAAGGVALAGAGTFFLLQAKGNYDALVNGTAAPADAARIRDSGKGQQTIGLALTGAGVAALAAAGLMFAMGGDEGGGSAAVLVAPNGVAVTGAF